jgi:phenylalanyl-tRNA synthetase beta chain
MLNNLSAELNILRPSMLETGLEAIAHNLNRRNNDLRFFEFGKTYTTEGSGQYSEPEHLCLYITGNNNEEGWRAKPTASDFYVLKGIVAKVMQSLGISIDSFETLLPIATYNKFEYGLHGKINGEVVLQIAGVNKKILSRFDIKQSVFFADLNWNIISKIAADNKPAFNQIPKVPAVQRDLALIVPSQLAYEEVEKTVQRIKLNKLQGVKLFDIFESEKLGADKKSMAVNFTFLDEEKTLTDPEIDGWMKKIMSALEKDLQAEIRR